MATGKRQAQIEITAQERQIQALGLRRGGAPYRAIAQALGISLGQAHDDVRSALEELAKLELTEAASLRQLELERLDDLLLKMAGKLMKGDVDAINAAVRISESRRRLLGLDAPAKIAPTTPDGQALGSQWLSVRTLVLTALADHPAAQLALAEALEETDATGTA